MSKTVHLAYRSAIANFTSSTTFYLWIAGYLGDTANTTEANGQLPLRAAGVASNLRLNITQNDKGTSSLTLRKNGSDGTVTVSITGSTTGTFEDLTHSDTIAAGDLLDWKLVVGSGGTVFSFGVVRWLFTASVAGNSVTRLALNALMNLVDSTTVYLALNGITGGVAVSATEASHQTTVRQAGSIKNLAVYCSANGRSTATTAILRKNTADGNNTLSIAGGATGLFEDTSNTDSFSAGDLLNYRMVATTGGGTFTRQSISCELITTTAWVLVEAYDGATATFNANTTLYLPLAGRLATNATENNQKQQLGYAGQLSKAQVYVTGNTVTAASTARLRINTANATVAISITASTTGSFEDTTHTDAFLATDDLNWQVVTGATGTSLLIRFIKGEIVLVAAPPPFSRPLRIWRKGA